MKPFHNLYPAVITARSVSKYYITCLIFTVILTAITGCGPNRGYSEEDFLSSYSASDFDVQNSSWGMWADAMSGIERNTLYVCRTGEVSDNVYGLVVDGLNKIIEETGRSVTVLDESAGLKSDYHSPDWYQQETLLDKEFFHGRQADGGRIINLLHEHDKSNDHFVVLITDADLTSGRQSNNFVFGLSSYPYIVVSAKRFMAWKLTGVEGFEPEIYDQAVSLVAAHEFGHYLDLVNRNINVWKDTGTLLDSHCRGQNCTCLMQQMNVDAEGCNTALEQANLIYERERWLCPDCAAEIYYRRQALEEAGFIW